MAAAAQSKAATGGANDIEEKDDTKQGANIGVSDFFIAKRASIKLIKFWRAHQQRKRD